MDPKRFNTLLRKNPPLLPELTSGFTKKLLLFLGELYYLTSLEGPLSTTQIWRKSEMRGKKIAYKNVRKKIDTLRRLGLIELKKHQSKTLEYDHNQKPYQLSTSGLMTLLTMLDPDNQPVEFSMLLRDFERIPVLKELLQFFEPATIRYMTSDETLKALPLAHELRSYVRDCISIIYYFNSISPTSERVVEHYDRYLDTIARTFLLKLASMLYQGPAACTQEVRDIREVLESDKRFTPALHDAMKDIDRLNAAIARIK